MSLTPRLDNLERNLIINGNFDHWQRGISSSSARYLADRFLVNFSGGYTETATQSPDVPTQAQSGWQSLYSLLITNGTGASPASGQYQNLVYRVEGQDYQVIHAKTARLQFWVKSSVAGTYSIGLANGGNTRSYVTTYTITTPNVWQKVALDIPLDSVGAWAFDNTVGLYISFTLTMGSAYQTSLLNTWQTANVTTSTTQTQWGATTGATFRLAQVSLIPQDFTQSGVTGVDVPFQRCGRSIGHELALCQRYYVSYVGAHLLTLGHAHTTSAAQAPLTLPVSMRAAPSVDTVYPWVSIIGDTPAGAVYTFTTLTDGGGYPNVIFLQLSGSATTLVVGNVTTIQGGASNAYLGITAEF
jgi:hypothetical protein